MLKRLAVPFLVATIGLGVISAGYPVASATTATTSSSSQITLAQAFKKAVYLTNNSYVRITDANLVQGENGKVVSFQLTYYNGGNTELNMIDYWARLYSRGGSKFNLKLTEEDSKVRAIAPKTSKTLTYYAEISDQLNWGDLILRIIKFDFNVSGYEVIKGQFAFPSNLNTSVKTTGYKPLSWKSSTVNMRIDKLTVAQSLSTNTIKLKMVMRNTGKTAVAAPQFTYYLQTAEGIQYQLTPETPQENVKLQPLILTELNLTGTVPSSIKRSGWSLVAVQQSSGEEGSTSIPRAQFMLPSGSSSSGSSALTQVLTGESGQYELKLLSLQRLPWNESDVLAAEMQVTNLSDSSMTLPDLSATLLLDDKITVESKGVKNPNQIALAKGEKTTYVLYGTIPYTYTFKKAEVTLSNKVDNDSKEEIAKFNWNETISTVPIVKSGQSYAINLTGRSQELKVLETKTFEAGTKKLLAVTFSQTNKNARVSSLPNWTGFFKSSTGALKAATIKESNASISSGNHELFTAWVALNADDQPEDWNLILGEGLSEGKYTEGEAKADGYAFAAEFELDLVDSATSFSALQTMGYSINLEYLTATLAEKWNLELKAEVTSLPGVESFPIDRKWQIAIVDQTSGREMLKQDIEFGKETAPTLNVGSNRLSYTIDPLSLPFGSTFILNVYEVFEGGRHLLASREYDRNKLLNIVG